MSRFSKCLSFFIALVLIGLSSIDRPVLAMSKEGERVAERIRLWRSSSGLALVEGRLVSQAAGLVRVEDANGKQVLLKTSQLSYADQRWLQGDRPGDAFEPVAAEVALAVTQDSTIVSAFKPFEKSGAIKTRSQGDWFWVESNGLPSHQMMVGIKTWQQQVPLPQKYVGNNAWRIPLNPKPAANPVSTKGRFLRGAIAVAVNGIPIFNPLNNRGADSYAIGELDEFGGHCGRADDYHYHIAPVHLEETVGKGKPIAYALDGYPIYGYTEPDGSPVNDLDECHGHADAAGNYHYHAAKKYPYLNGGFHGEVTEKDGQVDPQPRAEPIRPDTRPLPGAKIIGYQKNKDNRFELTYEQKGKQGTVVYELNGDGTVTFEFTEPDGKKTTETYSGRPRRGGPGGQGPQGRGQAERGSPEGRNQGMGSGGESGSRSKPEGSPPGERRGQGPPQRGNRSSDGEPSAPPRDTSDRSGEKARLRDGQEQRTPSAARSPSHARFDVASDSVDKNGFLNIACTCDGKRQSPEIHWGELPQGTKSVVVSIWHTAPDREKSYWLLYNIPADTRKLELNSKQVGKVGMNDKRQAGYDPPCSQGPGVKTYHISVFALSRELELAPQLMDRKKMLESIADCTLGEGKLDCKVERKAGE